MRWGRYSLTADNGNDRYMFRDTTSAFQVFKFKVHSSIIYNFLIQVNFKFNRDVVSTKRRIIEPDRFRLITGRIAAHSGSPEPTRFSSTR